MDRPRTPQRRDRLVDQPWDVQITVRSAPPPRVARAHVAGVPILTAARMVLTGALALAVIGAIVVDALPAQHVKTSTPVMRVSRTISESPYRYPLGCMGAGLSAASRPSVGELRGASSCWRYGVFVTAVLRQVHGVWGLALEAVSPACPSVSLPRFIRARLVACRRPTRGAGAASTQGAAARNGF